MNTILKFSASWCGPCKTLAPIIKRLSEEYKGKINFDEVSDEIDYSRFEKYAKKYSIKAIPVVIVLDKNENELERLVGLQKEEVYRDVIEKYGNK